MPMLLPNVAWVWVLSVDFMAHTRPRRPQRKPIEIRSWRETRKRDLVCAGAAGRHERNQQDKPDKPDKPLSLFLKVLFELFFHKQDVALGGFARPFLRVILDGFEDFDVLIEENLSVLLFAEELFPGDFLAIPE